jgi:hypothetical protein
MECCWLGIVSFQLQRVGTCTANGVHDVLLPMCVFAETSEVLLGKVTAVDGIA